MDLQGRTIGVAMSASHHTLAGVLEVVALMRAQGARIIPIVSQSVLTTATRFGRPEEWLARISDAAGRPPLTSIPEVEPIGPQRWLDALLMAPCTGSTLARLAQAVTDGALIMAAKSQLRIGRPVVLAITTNDALGLNAYNLARLLNTKNVYFVPFGQDDPWEKPNSLVSHLDLAIPTVLEAIAGRQLQPLLRPW